MNLIGWILAGLHAGDCRAAAEIPAFCWDSVGVRRSPWMFCTEKDTAKARERIRRQEYKQTVASLDEEADEGQKIQLTSMDVEWWQQAKDKNWSDIYPIIYQKTCLEPLGMARPAYYAAMRYLLGERSEDLDAAKRILLHLSDYSFEFEHYDVGMNYALWGHLVLNAYDLCSGHMSDAERTRLDAFFTRLGRAVMKNDSYWIEHNIGGGINNHLAWHKMMLGCLGVFYQHDELVDYALRGPRGLISLLDEGLVDDGLWCESSLTYHFTAIVPMVYLAEALRNAGHEEDLYTIVTPSGRRLRQAYDAMFGVLFPDGTIPPIGDAYGRKMKLGEEFTYWYACRAYNDPCYGWLQDRSERKRPELLFLGADLSRLQAPPVSSRVYAAHGYAFLRDRQDAGYWDSDGWCAFVTFDRSGVHCHQDKLSLMLFGGGRLLIADVEARATVPHAFSSQVQRELNRGGLSQNTVMIDYRDQSGIDQKLSLLEYRDEPEEKLVTVADEKGLLYEGVRQSRTVCVRQEYVLDVFQIVAGAQKDMAWIIHTSVEPASQWCSVELSPTKIEIPGAGSWLKDFRVGTADGDLRMGWSNEGEQFGMTMAAEPGTKVITCGYPLSDEPDCLTLPMVIVERHKESTIYAVVYQVSRDELPPIRIKQRDDKKGRLIYEVAGPWGRQCHPIKKLR